LQFAFECQRVVERQNKGSNLVHSGSMQSYLLGEIGIQ
jgi:hypothetical protein